MIKTSKPILNPKDLFCSIHLEENQVDYLGMGEKGTAEGFQIQTSRHITVLNKAARVAIENNMQGLSSSDREILLDDIKNLLESFDWQFQQSKESYHIEKEGTFGQGSMIIEYRETVISPIVMPEMEIFYSKLNELLGTSLVTQFPHITLFAKGDRPDALYRGIPIPNEKEFHELCTGKFS